VGLLRGRVLVRGALALAGALLAVGLAHAPRADATAHLVLRSGPLTATVQLDPFSITVAERGAVVLSTASAGRLPVGDRGPLSFALGARVAAQPPLMGYGLIADVPLTWFHATRAERRPDGSLLVHTTDPTRSFALRLRSAGDGIVEVDARLSNPDGVLLTGASFFRDSDERFVGFGERSDRVEQSGQVVEQWNEEGPFSAGMLRPATDPVLGETWQGPPPMGPSSNFTMPWMVSSRGFGFLLDSTWLNRFDLTGSGPWRVETAEPALRWRVYAGPTPAEVLRRATADPTIGRQPVPAPWFFGPWYQPTGSAGLRAFLQRAWRTPVAEGGYDVPVTVAQTYTHYLPCGAQAGSRPDGQRESTDRYHALGYKVTTYVNSFVCEDHPDGAYQTADRNGWFVETPLGTTYPMPYLAYLDASSAVIDFTAPGAADFWRSLVREALVDGYDGWMEDFGEYVPPESVLADGRTGLAGHNDYCTQYHRASHELTWPAKGPDFAQFVRCGYTGTGPVARIVWGGDPTEDDSEADGLAAAVNQGRSMGLSGIGYWGSDIGGFHSLFTEGRTDAELLVRWLEVGAFSPIMRTQAEGYPRPVLQDPARAEVWSPEVLPHWRALARLRTQLYPYLWAASQEYQSTGMPMMRDLVLAYPDSPVAWGTGDATAVAAARFEYLFGPDLLVAPVVDLGATAREVWLPPGQWVAFWDAVRYDPATGSYDSTGDAPVLEGDRVVHVEAPLGRTPLFVKAGTCLPMLPADVDTLADPPSGTYPDGIVSLRQGIDRIRQVPFDATCP
jgi:alpha-glucosidase (family GH31 glycosyl hydrolase)